MSGCLRALRRLAGIQQRDEERTLASAVHQEMRYVLWVDVSLAVAFAMVVGSALIFVRY
ncbi:hypothetical protein BSY19_4709 (plasmid) [Bosea sp. RAC05]|nr:hypothetical protein BSY19_4709 [Bosea sp. RAC05]